MAIYKCSAGNKQNKTKTMLIISHQQRITGKSYTPYLSCNQNYSQCFGWKKSVFLTQWFYTFSVFNMERYLACPTSLAVFINQDNQYQQNKQEKNIMIKCERRKSIFRSTILMKNIKPIFYYFFSKMTYLLSQNLSKSALLSGYLRTTKIYYYFGSRLFKLPIFLKQALPYLSCLKLKVFSGVSAGTS